MLKTYTGKWMLKYFLLWVCAVLSQAASTSRQWIINWSINLYVHEQRFVLDLLSHLQCALCVCVCVCISVCLGGGRVSVYFCVLGRGGGMYVCGCSLGGGGGEACAYFCLLFCVRLGHGQLTASCDVIHDLLSGWSVTSLAMHSSVTDGEWWWIGNETSRAQRQQLT